MCTMLMIGTLAAALCAQDRPGLWPRELYNPVGRPAIVEVDAPGMLEQVTLALMDHEGEALFEPVSLKEGPVDLNRLFPELPRLRRAAYLQMTVDGRPYESALVVEPMLSRLVPVTEDAVSPAGIRYTRIVDWIEEGELFTQAHEEAAPPGEAVPAPLADEGETRPEPEESERAATEPQMPAPSLGRAWLAPPDGDGRLFNGLRLYAERDVILETTAGDIRLALRPDEAPNTVFNFLSLCQGGFYRNIIFHRIVPYTRDGEPFVIQAGDPTATGRGGPGYWLPLERSGLPHQFGVISMARDVDPDSAGSQFFICLSRGGTARLDGHYCSFGYAVEGRGAILDIADVELADIVAGRAVQPPLIRRSMLIAAPSRILGEGRPDARVERRPPEPEQIVPERVPR